MIAFHPELLPRIVTSEPFICRPDYHLETEHGCCPDGIQGRKLRFIKYRNICHRQCCCLAVRAKYQGSFRNWNHPKQPGRRNRRMEVVDFVLRGNLPLKEGESHVHEGTGLRRAGGEIFSLHNSEVGAGCPERDPVAFVVGAHTDKVGASDDFSFEVENV